MEERFSEVARKQTPSQTTGGYWKEPNPGFHTQGRVAKKTKWLLLPEARFRHYTFQ